MLKVYFTHDRKAYMHTAKRLSIRVTANIRTGSKVYLCITVLLVLVGDNQSKLRLCHLKSEEMLYACAGATADTFLPLIHPLILTVNMGAHEGQEVLQVAYQCGFACAPSTHWGQCKLSHRYRT